MAWNREHVGVAAAPPVAIDWSVTAMTEAAGRLAEARISDRPRMAAAVAEAVWWVTLVDATLVRYHPRGYETALADKAVRRRKTEETLEGLRYVRNQLGKSVDPAAFIRPANDEGTGAWAWRRQPEPGLGDLSRAGSEVGAGPVPRLPGTARRARHRPDLHPLHGVPRAGRQPRRRKRHA